MISIWFFAWAFYHWQITPANWCAFPLAVTGLFCGVAELITYGIIATWIEE